MNTYRSTNAELMHMKLLNNHKHNCTYYEDALLTSISTSEERINDFINSKDKLEFKGIYIEDIIGVLEGDKAAAQVEIGHLKG